MSALEQFRFAPPIEQPRVLLAAVGDSNDERTWSGTPFHMLAYGRALGVIDAGLPLDASAPHWRSRRLMWNALRIVAAFERGGYQYSEEFLERLWQRADVRSDDTLINVFQLYPSRLFEQHRGAKWFFVDQTLSQAFSSYGLKVGKRMAVDAIQRERDQYHRASGVIAQSSWAARDIVSNYGVPEDRVRVSIPGANLDREAFAAWDGCRRSEPRSPDGPLRLVFVGKDWQRKGLDRLLRATAIARREGAPIEVVVIGVDSKTLPSEYAIADDVIWAGFIDKRRELNRFLDLIAACDVGCLLSRAEAGGISLREFAMVGLPTLAPDVGGAPEYVLEGASSLVGPSASDETIAAIIVDLARNRQELARRRRLAFERRQEASWNLTIAEIGGLIGRAK